MSAPRDRDASQGMEDHDVIVVGGGNAALCAALSARELGARVLVLERAPREQRGGSSAYSGGAFRVAYRGLDDLLRLVPDLSPDEIAGSDFGSYDETQFFRDLTEMSQFRCDPDLADVVVADSLASLVWLRGHGVRFVPIYGRQAYKVDGKFRFFGGLTVEVSGGGLGLMEALYQAAERADVHVRYQARVIGMARDRNGDWAVSVSGDQRNRARARCVVLGTGGFHANVEWRARYLGTNWDLAKARGSRFNTGDGIRIALDQGAMPHGHWTGCHSVFYDLNAPANGDIALLNQQKNYFTLGIVVNANGERYFDEGIDFRNYTYSNMGALVLQQPGAIAWQIFDQRTAPLLPDEYRVRHATRLAADTLEELADRMQGIDKERFLSTVREFNASVRTEVPFNPAVKDGRSTSAIEPPKSNWANPIDKPPYVAYAVTCGVTLTYGGVRIGTDGRVIGELDRPIAGLYAAGEIVGGLFYGKYPGGAGLTAGTVVGRAAGAAAARLALGVALDTSHP